VGPSKSIQSRGLRRGSKRRISLPVKTQS
jgi:hypothetical protein